MQSNISHIKEREKAYINSRRQPYLSQYVVLGGNAHVVWYEDNDRPTSLEEEEKLKRFSSFPYYSTSRHQSSQNARKSSETMVNSESCLEGENESKLKGTDKHSNKKKQRKKKRRTRY